MSTTITEGWLKDKDGVKFAPKTLISQVITSDGVALDEQLAEKFKNIAENKADVSALNDYTKTADLETDLNTRDEAITNYVNEQFTSKVGAQTVEAQLNAHNGAADAHADIRKEVADLSKEVADFTGLNDETVEKLEAVLELLDQNGESLEELLSGKVNTSDIADNLTTNDAAKVLSANQGAVIQAAMDVMNVEIGKKADATDLNDYAKKEDLADGTVVPAKANSLNVAAAVGASNQPVYIQANGTPKAISYTISKSVPSDAKFTDTTYSAAGINLGLVKTGGDVTISSGVITVNDNSHNHKQGDVTGLDTALANKQATITGAATTITTNNLTPSRALISNTSGKVAVSAVGSTELGYLGGVKSNIQDQFNAITGSSFTAAKATADKNGNDITTQYALYSTVQSIIGGSTTVGNATYAASAGSADSAKTATKATQDAIGNTIATTYATKTDVTTVNTRVNNIVSGAALVGKATYAETANRLRSDTLGSANIPIYLAAGAPSVCNKYAGGTKITLNGISEGANDVSFYAPTSGGESGQVLISNGTNSAPSWGNISVSGGSSYTLPTASSSTKGGVKINGNGLGMSGDTLQLYLGTGMAIDIYGRLTLSNPLPSGNNGQFLRVVNGAWTAVTINTAESGAF